MVEIHTDEKFHMWVMSSDWGENKLNISLFFTLRIRLHKSDDSSFFFFNYLLCFFLIRPELDGVMPYQKYPPSPLLLCVMSKMQGGRNSACICSYSSRWSAPQWLYMLFLHHSNIWWLSQLLTSTHRLLLLCGVAVLTPNATAHKQASNVLNVILFSGRTTLTCYTHCPPDSASSWEDT